MKPLLHPFLVNDRFGDPALYVRSLFERRSFLFDMGDLGPLSPRRLLGMSVEIGAPRYLGVSVVARVEVQPGRDAELTRQRAMEALYRDLDPITGGPDGLGWPWARRCV